MYKLREERLREFYVTGEMDSPNIGITKAPLTPSHGESISDQSFQSFKTKEIRDSASPTHELKYTRGGVIVPDTSGWNVVTSSEVSPDGKSYKTETLASTEGTQKISGGHSQFAGKNEHLQSASHKGDDKNFVKTASEKSNTQLQEKIVVGDENNGRMEQKSSSVVSSSHVTTSKQSSYGPDAGLDHQAVLSDFDQLVDSTMPTKRTTVQRNQQQQQEHQQRSESTARQERQVREYQQQEERQHQQKHYQQTQNEQYVIEDNTNQQQLRTNQTHTNEANKSEQIKRKLIQEEVDLLAAAPGKIISRTVDYPDPNTKVITETKTLPDGTTVTTRKFETKSAKSKTWSSSSNQKESTSSRTIVEDRAQRNRVEYVVDGKEKVISDDYSERRITDRDTPQILRDTGRKTENKHQTKEEVFTKETTQQKQVHDRVDQKVHKTVTKEEKIFQDELRKENRQQDNIVRRTDKVPTDRAENLKDQFEVFETDTVHKTVKKDLNQTLRDSKLTNQDFIQTERGCSMVDHSRIVPEKYTSAPKTDSTETRIHVTRTTTEQQDNRGCVDVSREQFITQQQRPDHPGSPKKPSQDYTTHGFPSVRPHDSSKPQKRDQDFTTEGFPSVKSPGSHRPTQDPRYSSPDRPTSTTTQTFEKQNVEQTVKSQKTVKSSEHKTHVTRQSEDFTTHGFPSVSPPRGSPARQPEDRQQKIPIQPDHTTQTVHETRQTVEERTVRKGQDDFTTQGFPSARPERGPQPTPSERSPRQPIDKYRQPDHPDHTSQTVQVQQLQQQQTRQSTDQQITRQNLVQEYSSVKPDRRSPSTPHEGSPKQPLERPKEPNQQQTVEKHFYTESRQTVVDRDQERRQSPYIEPQKPGSTPHHPDGSYPSKDTPQRYLQEPSQRYPHESTPKYPQEPGQKYPQEPSKRYPEEPGQRYTQPSDQKYPQEPYQRHPKEPTRGYPQEPVQRYSDIPTENYPQEPAQRYPTEQTRPEYPSEKIPKGYAKQPQQSYQTSPKDVTKSTHVTEIRTTTQQVQPNQFKEPYPSTHEVVRPDQPYRPDADDASSITTERTDISDTSRRNRKDYLNTRVTVEVDAAHDAFARSLRCVSPVDQTRGSIKSLKSISSIRSSSSPDKRSHRSPSHESDTSKFSTSTITKPKDTRDSVRKSTSPTKKSPLKDKLSPRDRSYPKEQKDFNKPNEPADSHRTRPRKDEPSIRPTKKPEVIRSPEDTKASRYQTSVNEVSKRPGTYPSRPSDSSRATPKKYDSRPTPSDEFSTSPTRKGTRPSPTIQTDQPTSDNTKPSKFTKTVKVDNAILRDNTTPKRPGKPQYSDDEGFEPESPRSGSPSYPKRFEERPKLTTDLDSTDITVQVNLKNVGRNIDLSTTITDTDSTTKNYRNEEFITREKDDTVISNKKTTTVENTDKRPEKETHFPTETGEPFYLISSDQPKPKGGKEKPPLNRSETYEERCRQILGMDQTLKDTKKTKSTITEDFITTERIVQEKDKVGKIPSPVPSPRSSSPRKHHTTTTTDNITITGRAPSQTPDQSPTRKPKGPDSSGYTTPKDSPTASPYSSLSRKSTPRNTPIDSPYTRSPTSSPTRKNQSTSPQRPVSRESIPRRPEFDDSETITNTRFVEKTTRETERDLTKRSSIRRSPSPSQSPAQSPERKPFRKSPRQSPERYVPSSITIETRSKEDRRSVDSTIKSVRKEPYKTEVCYEVTKPRSRSPSGSPRRNTPYESSPKRDQYSVTEKYISNVSRTNKEEVKDTDDIRRTRVTKTTKTTQVKDTPATTRYGVSSPTRRPQQPEEPKAVPKKTTTPITSRVTTLKTPTNQRGIPVSNSTLRKPVGTVPSTSPLKGKPFPSRPAASSPSRRSPSVPESETFRRTKNEQMDTRKIASTVKTTKTSTITETEDQANHVTIAKIQLSPTPTRKITSPEKKIPKQPEVRIFRPTTTPVTTKVTKTTTPRRDQPERTQPLRRPDVKKPKETATTRRRIEKQTVTVEDESDSSLVREKEEVTVIRQTREMPITIVGKTQPSKKAPVTERKESAPIYGTRNIKDTTQKMNRSTSDNVLKTSTVRETRSQYDKNINVLEDKPTRRDSTDKPHSKSERRPSKHLATKTINLSAPTGIIINSEDMENVIIDIQQAKSSREPSPNKIIPTPVPLDEYTGKPRYPDTVQEPDEESRRKPKVKNIPIFEEETNNFVGCYITEVDETLEKRTQKRTTEVSDDETLVKTSRAQRISRESSPHKEPKYLPDGSVVDDECLLSVHDKVNKFINTAEEIKKPKASGPFRREKPSVQLPEKDDCLLSVNAKVSKFSTTAENVTKTPRKSPPKQIGRPNIDEIDEDLRTDECILSVSEKVNKFINTAEKLVSPVPQRSPELVAKVERQISRQSDESDKEVVTKTAEKTTTVTDRYTGSVGKKTTTDKPASPKPTLKSSAAIQKAKQVFENGGPTTPRQKDILSRPSVWEGRKQTTNEVRLEDIGVYKKHGKDSEEIIERTEHTSSRSPTRNDETYSTKPLRSTAAHLKDSVSSKRDSFETRTTSKTNVTSSETTKTTRKTSDNLLESRTERRSSGDYSRYPPSKETSPNRYYPDDHSPSRYSKETETTSRRTEETIRRSGSPQSKRYSETDSLKKPSSHGRDDSPCSREHSHRSRITTDSVSAKRNLFEKTEKAPRTHSPVPAGPRPSYMDHTMSSLEHIRRDSVEVNKNYQRKTSMDSTSTHEYDGSPRSGTKFGVDLKRVDSKGEKMRRRSSSAEIPHIEEIFDLELLEQMLHTVTGYEHRRRIRSQIRVVKKMIETQNRDACHTEYIRIVKEERSSSRGSSPSPDRQYDHRSSPSLKESFKTSSSRFIETESKHTSREVKREVKERSVSPQAKVERYETIRQIKRTGEKPKTVVTKQVREEKPIWATKNILKKATQNNQAKSVATKKVTSTTTSKTQTRRQKTEAEEDSVISCYGIGPTDEDGKPLFGIRALQKRNKPSETTKVTGTVITEKYYSENGAPPVGERKVTVYSSSPDDVKKIESKLSAGPTAEMIKRERSSKDGITTVTRMEKISKTRDAEEQDIPAIMPTETKDLSAKPKIVRKGSVKEITEKYIRKTSTSSIPDKSNRGDYPKAGLILRTQTHTNRSSGSGEYYVSDSGSINDSGDESPSMLQDLSTERNGTVEPVERNCSKFSSSSKSFLNSSGTKVSGVNDILDKMRNADNVVEDGDTAEDKEARSLLNKFLGASILMTGMESMVPKKVVGNIGGPEIRREEIKTSRQIKTKEDFSAPVEEKTCDFEDIWDLEVLKQLLQKSINYEERRRIRARIRQLMAEREEICTTQTTEKKEESDGAVVTTTTKVTTRTVAAPPKPISPFAKFRQLDKQQSLQSPNSPVTPTAPGVMGRGAPLFKFTDPSLNARAATAKEQLLYWCQMKTKEYENVQITNFSASWTDGLAFCALIHHFLPDAFDYSTLTPQQRRHNFELAFRVADEKAGIAPLLDVEDMVVMKRPDWKCVFTYVQSIYRRFRNSQ